MAVNVTPEVVSAHKNLEEVCKRLETSVDKFCASPLQSLCTQDFYESECVPIAVECVNALFKFQTATLMKSLCMRIRLLKQTIHFVIKKGN